MNKLFDLTLTQNDIYLDQIRHEGSPLYNIGGYIRMGKVDPERLALAHKYLINSEDIFGLRIKTQAGEVKQYISDTRNDSLEFIDLSRVTNSIAEANSFLKAIFRTPFQFENSALFRTYLLRLSNDEHWYVGISHHLMMDGWGFSNWSQKLSKYYEECKDKEIGSSECSLTWQQFAIESQKYLQSKKYESDRDFWRSRSELADSRYLPRSNTGIADTPKSQRYLFDLPKELVGKAEEFSSKYSVSIANTFLACCAGYFSSAYDRQQLVFGVPIHNRKNAVQKNMLGVLASVSLLPINMKEDYSFVDLARKVSDQQKSCYKHSRYPIGHIVNDLALNCERAPCYDVCFSYLRLDQELSFAGERAELVYLGHDHEMTPLMITVWDKGDACSIQLQVDFNFAYFSEAEIKLFTERFSCLLDRMLSYPETPTRSVSLLPDTELKDVINLGQNESWDVETLEPAHKQIEYWADKTPKKIAVRCCDSEFTFGELNERANKLAHYLVENNVKQGDIVAVALERSVDMVASVLAIMKSGAGYLPLDLEFPEDRVNFMLTDSRCKLVMTTDQRLLNDKKGDFRCFDPSSIEKELEKYDGSNLGEVKVSQTSLAYVIYTSGSTGRPKGVMIEHAALATFLAALKEKLGGIISEKCRLLAVTTIAFDIANLEIFGVLGGGGSIVLTTAQQSKNAAKMAELIDRYDINCMQATPSSWTMFKELDWRGKQSLVALSGGEPLSCELAQFLLTKCSKLLNCYGPTEATIWSMIAEVRKEDLDSGTIYLDGNLKGYKHCVLNKDGELSPQGVMGELHIGGQALARGYLNRPELNAERFFASRCFGGNERLYKTGDLARWTSDGKLEFLGRADDQVKIQGYRIELSEIESAIVDAEAISKCVVKAQIDKNKKSKLIAYAVFNEGVDRENYTSLGQSIRQKIKQRLPKYMIPAELFALDKIPLTPNGKIDKKALPISGNNLFHTEYIAPQKAIEKKLVNIISQLLNVPEKAVSTSDNFFDIGGNSLSAMKLIGEIRQKLNRQISIVTIFEVDNIAKLADIIEQAPATSAKSEIKIIDRSNNNIPLSFEQQSLWLVDKLEGSQQYHLPIAFNVDGYFNIDAAERALSTIISRHEPLRTVYVEKDGQVEQQIQQDFEFKLKQFDLTAYDKSEKKQLIEELILENRNRPFDLSRDLMVRASYAHTEDNNAEQKGVVMFCLHHISADGWSVQIIIKEFMQLYHAAIKGVDQHLEALDVRYSDYSFWQRDFLSSDELSSQLDYWSDQLADLPAIHGLPLDYPRPKKKCFVGKTLTTKIDKDLTSKTQQLAKKHDLTLFMLLHSVFNLVLSKHSGLDDIVLGTAIANRQHSELSELIGFFANVLVLRTSTKFDKLGDYLSHVKSVNLEAQANQDLPFAQLVEHLCKNRNPQYTPLFQIVFRMIISDKSDIELPGVKMSLVGGKDSIARFDLDLEAMETESGIELSWNYDTSLFKTESIERLARHVKNLLQCMVTESSVAESALIDGELSLSKLVMIDESETKDLSNILSGSRTDLDDEYLLHQLVELQAGKFPDKVALICEGETLTYKEVNERANQIAHYLVSQGIKPNMLVGLCLERSNELIVAMIGILKAGGAYLPLDPKYPDERITYLLEDSGVSTVVTQSYLEASIPFSKQFVLSLDKVEIAIDVASQSSDNLDKGSVNEAENSLAYVIYTSGSTGNPKGVMIEHQAVVEKVISVAQYYDYRATDTSMLFASINFDASITQLFCALSCGGCVVIRPDSITDPVDLLSYACKHNVSILHIVPQYFQTLLEGGHTQKTLWHKSNLRHVVCGGDELPLELAEKWMALGLSDKIALHNSYGPTETCVTASIGRVDVQTLLQSNGASKNEIPLGKPLNNTQFYIVDQYGQLAPKGSVGELYIGGRGVARGYHERSELNRESFIVNSFIDDKESDYMLYRSGDLVKLNKENQLIFIGRKDRQVKVRGFRIELGEIEYYLNALESVSSCAVLLKENGNGEKCLEAYVVLNDRRTPMEDVNFELGQRLPYYMLPSSINRLDVMPLNSNGKIDRNALRFVTGKESRNEVVAPRTRTESRLLNMWQDLLDKQEISVTDNFFKLGGHSLLATRLASQIRSTFDVNFTLKSLFEAPSIEEQADQVELQTQRKIPLNGLTGDSDKPSGKNNNITSTTVDGGSYPLSFAQQRLWFIDQLDQGSAQYNALKCISVEGNFDLEIAETAISRIISRHAVLRTVFTENEAGSRQLIREMREFKIDYINLTQLDEKQKITEVEAFLERDRRKLFNLQSDLMVRVSYLDLHRETGNCRGVLAFNIHHIASDAWSMGVLIREFCQQYKTIAEGKDELLPPLDIQYADFAVWQKKNLNVATQLAYWKEKLTNIPSIHNLPLDYARPELKQYVSNIVKSELPVDLTSNLKLIANDQGVTLFMLLHAALGVVISRHSHSNDIVIGTPVANRLQNQLTDLIGFFVNNLVLRTSTDFHQFNDYLQHVKSVNLEAQDNQDVPFEQVVEHCWSHRETQYSPLFQIVFKMNTNSIGEIELPDINAKIINDSDSIARYDLDLEAEEINGKLSLNWNFDKALFSEAHIQQLDSHFRQLLTQISLNIECSMADLSLLDKAERRELVELFDNYRDIENSRTCLLLHKDFEKQVQAHAKEIALIDENCQLTYESLNKKANRLAHFLVAQGVKPNSLVGLFMEKSQDMVVALLAILKAGGAYMPLDPEYPSERIEYMLNDSKCQMVLSRSGLTDKLPAKTQLVLKVDELNDTLVDYPDNNLDIGSQTVSPEDLAYVIYTSGSSGEPKGVMVAHRAVAEKVASVSHYYALNSYDRSLLFASINFDASITQLFAPLCSGGGVVLRPAAITEPLALVEYICRHEVSIFHTVPQYLKLIMDEKDLLAPLLRDSCLRHVISGGDVLNNDVVESWFSLNLDKIKLHNSYGPTETTVTACIDTLTREKLVNGYGIGSPLPGTCCYVLDQHGQLAPRGAMGELAIGGSSVSKGYINKPLLSQRRFINNDFSDNGVGQIYLSGDLVRITENGLLEFIGRKDNQVKIRGFRVELEEVEYHLSKCMGLADCAVIASASNDTGEKSIVAYVKPGDSTFNYSDIDDEKRFLDKLEQELANRLPVYMLPSLFICAKSLPLNSSGKIDRQALATAEVEKFAKQFIPPRTEIEKTLMDIWRTLLECQDFGVKENFFKLGGHSLLATRLASQIRSAFDIEFTLKSLFDAPSVESQALIIGHLSRAADPTFETDEIEEFEF